MKVLVINCGSSSLKYQLIDSQTEEVLAKGLCERIGIDGSKLTHKPTGKEDYVVESPMKDHQVAVKLVLDALTDKDHGVITDIKEISAVGHRVLHAGQVYSDSIVVNEDVKRVIRECFDLGPLHNPANLNPENCKVIVCHLGNGASISASIGGKCVDTSMGLTPLEGLIMGTRSGDVDPAVVQYICNKENKTVDEVLNILNKKSGVLGISGVSSDFRDVTKAENEGNERAKAANEAFIYRVIKYIGAYVAAMNGVDAIAFTAGVGENDVNAREKILSGLTYLGIEVDHEANKRRGENTMISTPASKVKVAVIPTNEELAIARETVALV